MAGEIRLLRQIADGRAGLHKAAAAVGFDEACDDFQQRRLAGAVAADQADAFRGGDRELDAGEQRRAAEGERDIFQLDQRRRHRAHQAKFRRAWYAIRRQIASALAMPVPWLTIDAKGIVQSGNRHVHPARNLSRLRLQHVKTVGEQDP